MNRRPNNFSHFALGAFLTLAFNFILLFTSVLVLFDNSLNTNNSKKIISLLIAEIIAFGINQYIFILPITIWQTKRGNIEFSKGIVAGSLFILIVNILFIAYIAYWLSRFTLL